MFMPLGQTQNVPNLCTHERVGRALEFAFDLLPSLQVDIVGLFSKQPFTFTLTPSTPFRERGVQAAVRHMAAALPMLGSALWVAALKGWTAEAHQLLLVGANIEERGGSAGVDSTLACPRLASDLERGGLKRRPGAGWIE